MAYSGTNIRILHSGLKARDRRGIPETMICRMILVIGWSFEPHKLCQWDCATFALEMKLECEA